MLKKLIPVILLTFVNVIGFTLLIPVLPAVISRYADSSAEGVLYGGIISTYAICQFLAAPALGSLSDRYGRRPILFISQLGTTISWIIFGLAYFIPNDHSLIGFNTALVVIFFSRIVDGLTGGNMSVANAWVSDSSTRQERTRAFGMLGAVTGFGLLFGPALGGFAGSTSLGYLGTAIIAFLVSFITLIMIYLFLPESLSQEDREGRVEINIWQHLNVFNKLQPFRGNRLVMNLFSVRFFFDVAFSAYTTVIILLLRNKYGLDATILGLLLSLFGLFAVFNQAYFVGRIAGRINETRTLYAGTVILFFSLVTVPLIPVSFTVGDLHLSLLIMILNGFFVNLGASMIMPTSKSLLSNNVSSKKQGAVIGVNESLLSLANGMAPVISGATYTSLGSMSFLVYGFLLLLPYMFLWARDRRVI